MNTAKTYAEKIATDYAPKETSDLKALKKLDRKAKQMANFVSYTHGIEHTHAHSHFATEEHPTHPHLNVHTHGYAFDFPLVKHFFPPSKPQF